MQYYKQERIGSINRNIVECKDGYATFGDPVEFSINRNIVECKVIIYFILSSCPPLVLIETLWNVKRNTQSQLEQERGVLIETLWNVKLKKRFLIYGTLLVLIETLWNVKRHFSPYIRRT